MTSKTKTEIESIRRLFQESGCKKISYMIYEFSDKTKTYLFEYFVQSEGKEDNIFTYVNIKSVKLNEFAYYIHDYGSEHPSGQVRGPFPGKWNVTTSLHLMGPFSFPFYKVGARIYLDELNKSQFVELCREKARQIFAENSDIEKLLQRHTAEDIGQDQRIAILLFQRNVQEARKLIEQFREPDGHILRLYMKNADAYLKDLGR